LIKISKYRNKNKKSKREKDMSEDEYANMLERDFLTKQISNSNSKLLGKNQI